MVTSITNEEKAGFSCLAYAPRPFKHFFSSRNVINASHAIYCITFHYCCLPSWLLHVVEAYYTTTAMLFVANNNVYCCRRHILFPSKQVAAWSPSWLSSTQPVHRADGLLFCSGSWESAFCISLSTSDDSGASEMTQVSLVLSNSSRHRGHVVLDTFLHKAQHSIQCNMIERSHTSTTSIASIFLHLISL